jgi:hypothetical protein
VIGGAAGVTASYIDKVSLSLKMYTNGGVYLGKEVVKIGDIAKMGTAGSYIKVGEEIAYNGL